MIKYQIVCPFRNLCFKEMIKVSKNKITKRTKDIKINVHHHVVKKITNILINQNVELFS